jgi:hypothetical protein
MDTFVGKTITGRVLKQLVPEKCPFPQFIKITNTKMKHRDFQYFVGENENFDELCEYDPQIGLSFIPGTSIADKLMSGDGYHEVTIADDEKVFIVSEYKFNARTITLGQKNKFVCLTDNQCIALVKNGVTISQLHNMINDVRRFYDNEEFAFAYLSINNDCMSIFSDRIKRDRKIILHAIMMNSSAMIYAPLDFYDDEEIAFMILSKYGHLLNKFSNRIKNNKSIVLAAIRIHGLAIKDASESLQNDHEIVMAAIENNPCAFAIMNNALKNDKTISFAAIKNNVEMFKYTLRKNDREIVNYVVSINPKLLIYSNLCTDKEFIMEKLREGIEILSGTASIMRNNLEIILAAVQINGMQLAYAHNDIKKNKGIVQAAIKQNKNAIKFAHKSIRNELCAA